MAQTQEQVFRVSQSADPVALAGAMAQVLLHGEPEVVARAIGVGAVNQSVKAIALARGKVASSGRDLITRIGFQTVRGKSGDDISAVVFRCTTDTGAPLGGSGRSFEFSPISDSVAQASDMAEALQHQDEIVVLAVGEVGAVNQAVKAIAIARGKVAPSGLDLITRVGIQDVEDDYDDDISSVVFRCAAQ